jgi:hypothetical protein
LLAVRLENIDPSIIGKAPDVTEEADVDLAPAQEQELWRLISELQVNNASLKAENDELRAKVDLDTEKAKLVKPYANKVFWFLAAYCLAVFGLILLHGWSYNGFKLETTTLGIVSGSTAVSAIGLVGIIVKGLFGPRL